MRKETGYTFCILPLATFEGEQRTTEHNRKLYLCSVFSILIMPYHDPISRCFAAVYVNECVCVCACVLLRVKYYRFKEYQKE